MAVPRKSELQAELDALKGNVNATMQASPKSSSISQHTDTPQDPASSQASPPRIGVASLPVFQESMATMASATIPPYISPGTSTSSPALQTSTYLPTLVQQTSMPLGLTPADSAVIPTDTLGRKLDDVFVGPKAIEDCFQECYSRYSVQLPVVETELAPNACYVQSPFLFWTIVFIGSRKYHLDPTLFAQLTPAIIRLAKDAAFVQRTETTLTTIQALILLCVWPIPHESTNEDITPILSGILLQKALSVGLHIFGVGQDFSRIKLQKDRAQMDSRARLWAYCIVVCQRFVMGPLSHAKALSYSVNIGSRVSCTAGVPPVVVPDNYEHECTQAQTLHALPPKLRLRKTLSRILTEAILELERYALSKSPEHRGATLNPIIDAACLAMAELEPDCLDELDRFFMVSAELQISAFHLLAPRDTFEQPKLERMYTLACTAVELIQILDQKSSFARYSPASVQMYLALASLTILKLSRSHISDSLDLERGKLAYFAVIEMCREFSIESSDSMARLRSILTQLWTSKKIFKKPDGTSDALSLRCGSRLAMSILFDMLWWWRAEFGGVPNPYEDRSQSGSVHRPLDRTRLTEEQIPQLRDQARPNIFRLSPMLR